MQPIHTIPSITKTLLALLAALQISHSLPAQSPITIDQWRAHLPYHAGRYVTQSPSTAYYATGSSILGIDKNDFSLQFLDKTNTLSDVGVGIIKYSPIAEALLVTYTNSTFDIVQASGVRTYDNISTDGNYFNRTINDIYLYQDTLAYFSCGFGIVSFNLAQEKFGFTAALGTEALSLSAYKGYLYVATLEGLYRADVTTNLQDFNNWQPLGPAEGFPVNPFAQALGTYQNQLYIGLNDTLYTFDGNSLQYIHQEPGMSVHFITAEGERLVVGFQCDDCDGKVLYFKPDGSYQQAGNNCFIRPLYAIEDQYGRMWHADQWRGIRRTSETNNNSPCESNTYNSPYTANLSEISIHDSQVWVASGGIKDNESAFERTDGFFSFIDNRWNVYNLFTHPEQLDTLKDFYRIAIHPDGQTVYIGTFWNGLVALQGNEMTTYNKSNSSLQRVLGDPGRERVSGLAFDSDNNLWVSNHGAPQPISVLKADGTWQSFSVPANINNAPLQVVVDSYGYKWFVTGNTTGLLLFDEGEMNTNADNRSRLFTSTNSELPTSEVNCIAVDLEGDIWVGTDDGVVTFECADAPFDTQCQGARRIVEQGGFAAYLLEGESVRAIAIDGANRKWIGTTNGVFVQSPNGEKQEAFFDKDNSPLLDNIIIDIAIDQQTGEVYIGTEKGIISYRAEATSGGDTHQPQVYAYPNPVRPGYDGPIAIKGLPRDADVKITNTQGYLVYEGKAFGGQAVWDGRDYNGQKAASGVYLVYTSSRVGSSSHLVSKIILVR